MHKCFLGSFKSSSLNAAIVGYVLVVPNMFEVVTFEVVMFEVVLLEAVHFNIVHNTAKTLRSHCTVSQ